MMLGLVQYAYYCLKVLKAVVVNCLK